MFDKFGEFDSAEEINRAAAAQKAKGDLEAIKEICKENGIDELEGEDYWNGLTDQICTPLIATLGKLKVEKEEMKLEREFAMLTEELERACIERRDLAAGVRKKGKRLAEYLAKIIDKGYQDAVTPHKAILAKVTAVPSQYRDRIKTGMPDKKSRREIMVEYYLGEKVDG